MYEAEEPPEVWASEQNKLEWELRQKKLAKLRAQYEWDQAHPPPAPDQSLPEGEDSPSQELPAA